MRAFVPVIVIDPRSSMVKDALRWGSRRKPIDTADRKKYSFG